MKRILKGLLAAGLAVSLAVPGTLALAAVEQEEELRYSYKMNFVKNEFLNSYGYTGGSDAAKGDGGGKKPGAYDVAGKYGSATQIDWYGYKVLDGALRYGAYEILFTHNPINVGYERIHFDDYVQEVQSISFWTKTPMMQYNSPGVDKRQINFSIGTPAGNFSKNVELPNTSDWNYVILPFDEMMSGGKSLKAALAAGEVASLDRFTVNFGYGGFFGQDPTDETREDPSKQWYEYLIIDEMLMNRSTPEKPALIPPSNGEESYSMNANIKTMAVDGVPVAGFDPGAAVNEIEVPGYYTAEDILEHVTAVVAAPSVEADSTHQPVSGATYEVTPPASVPGEGKVTVYSADYSDKRTYQLKFVPRNGFQVDANEITGIDFTQDTIPGGNTTVTVPVVNESASESVKASVIGVVRDTQSGEVYSAQVVNTGTIAPGAKQNVFVNMNVPGNGDYCMASLYFVDDLANLNTVYPAISTGDDEAVVTKDSTAKITGKTAAVDNQTRQVTVSGSVSGAKNGETVNVAVYRPGAADKTAENLVNFAAAKIENGRFNYTYINNTDTSGYAKMDLGVGKSVEETGVYMAAEGQAEEAMAAYRALTADAGNEDYLAFMNSYGAVLGCAMDMYQRLTSAQQGSIVKAAVGKNYTDTELAQKLNHDIAFDYLASGASAETMAEMFKKYSDAFGFDTANEYYQKYVTDDIRLADVFAGMKGETYQSMAAAAEGFDSYTALCAINHVKTYTDVTEILNDFKTAIGSRFKYAKYNALTSSQKKSFAGKVSAAGKLKDFDALNTVLTNYILSLGKGGSTGGSGGSGGRPSGGNTSPVITIDKGDTEPAPTEQPIINTSRFSDMADAQWAAPAAEALYDLGIISGDGSGAFRPNSNVTREEFAKMLVGVFGLERNANPVSFRDVEEEAWYAEYISVAAQHGIVMGDDAGNFGVGQSITRQDMAVMILRALDEMDKKPDTTVKENFADDMEIADYAKEAVYSMNNAGIVSGVGDNRFAPTENATRAEAAKMLYGVYQYAVLGK